MTATSAVDGRLRERAAHAPGQPALVADRHGRESVLTWAELDLASARTAQCALTAAPRHRRCVLLARTDNGADSVAELAGMLRTDLPVAVTSRHGPEAELLALTESLLRDGYDVVRMRDGRPEIRTSSALARTPLPRESLLLATGGSSGRPKIVVDARTRTLARRPRATRPSTMTSWRPGQRQMTIGPLYHAAALTFFVEGLADGNMLIVPRVFDPAAVLDAIATWRVEWLETTPYHLRHLALAVAHRGHHELAGVRGLLHLAAPCPDQVKRNWLDRLGPERVFEMYGATEGLGVTLVRGDEWLRRPGTVGRGFFTQIRILDETGRRLPPGETGEIYLRSGPSARRVYLNAAHRVKSTMDGFACVGDRGRLDTDGYLYLAPRQLTRVQVGGETVDPAEVESVLMEHPAVLDAAVVGVPDDRTGESLTALIVPVGLAGVDVQGIRRYLRDHVARHKVPRVLRLVERLPRTEAGKLDRRSLAELAVSTQPA